MVHVNWNLGIGFWWFWIHVLCAIEKNFQKFFRKCFKVFQSPKIVWNGFCAMKEHSKVIFCWLHFFSPMKYGGSKHKNFNFLKKIFKIFWSPKMVWNGFCAMKEHSKVIFWWLHLFHLSSIGVETYQNFEFFEKNFQRFSKS